MAAVQQVFFFVCVTRWSQNTQWSPKGLVSYRFVHLTTKTDAGIAIPMAVFYPEIFHRAEEEEGTPYHTCTCVHYMLRCEFSYLL